MTIPTATKNGAADAATFTHASLHTDYPGTTGTNELAGGVPAYARKAITMNASSGGVRNLASSVVFDVLASTIRWIGYWNGGTFVICAPNGGGTPRNFMAIPSTDVVYSTAHGFSDTNKIVFYNGTPPTGLTEGTVYFARDCTTDSFKVAATAGGAAIDITGASGYQCAVCGITEDVYAVQGTHTLTATVWGVPD